MEVLSFSQLLVIDELAKLLLSVSSLCSSTGGPGLSALRLGHWDAGRHFPGDPQDLLRQVVQGGRQFQWRGLDHAEGGLQAKGDNRQIEISLGTRNQDYSTVITQKYNQTQFQKDFRKTGKL